jgi:hypothetical protein
VPALVLFAVMVGGAVGWTIRLRRTRAGGATPEG